MKEKALADDDGFWFMVQAKAEPTDTDQALVKWLTAEDNDIYFDAIGDKDAADKIYGDAQTFHKATRLAPKIVHVDGEGPGRVDEENDRPRAPTCWPCSSPTRRTPTRTAGSTT